MRGDIERCREIEMYRDREGRDRERGEKDEARSREERERKGREIHRDRSIQMGERGVER